MVGTVLAALAGAGFYRVRGGWLPTGSTQLARAIWHLPIAGRPVDRKTAWGELFFGALAWAVLVTA